MDGGKTNSLNNMFTRSVIRHFLENNTDKTYLQIIKRYIDHANGKTNRDIISEIYNVLKVDYRNEYYYKNTLLNKLLLGKHSPNTTTALTEVAIAKSKADFVLINGKAVVYEIKTELDNLDRLENQIKDYYKAFDHVVIVTYQENIPIIKKIVAEIGKPVGICYLQKNGTISTVQDPERYNESISIDILFKLLRKHEYEEILLKWFHKLPDVSEFQYYTACKKLFTQIPVDEAYVEVLMQLKKRGQIVKESFDKVPYELKFLVYFMKMNVQEYEKLFCFLDKAYGGG